MINKHETPMPSASQNKLILAHIEFNTELLPGWRTRKEQRKKEDFRNLRKAISIFQQHLPGMCIENPESTRFSEVWPSIDKALQTALGNTSNYRRAYNFISFAIEDGNENGLWQLDVPTPWNTIRRIKPTRNNAWHKRSTDMLAAEKQWRAELNPTMDTEELFILFLTCSLLYSGLTRMHLWPALARSIMQSKPLQGSAPALFISLETEPSENYPSNFYRPAQNQGEDQPACLVNLFLDPTSLAVLSQLLRTKPDAWQPNHMDDSSLFINHYRAKVASQLDIKISRTLFRDGAAAVTENQTGVNLPQILVEYITGRKHSASLPLCYWKRLYTKQIYGCSAENINLLKTASNAKTRPVKRLKSKPSTIVNKLKKILRKDLARHESRAVIINAVKQLITPDLDASEDLLCRWLYDHLAHKKNAVSTAERYLTAIGDEWIAEAYLEPLDTFDGEDFHTLYLSILNRRQSDKNREFKADRLFDMHSFAVLELGFAHLPFSLNAENKKTIIHISASIIDEPLFLELLAVVKRLYDTNTREALLLQTFLIMAYRTGLRPGELAKLRLKDTEPSPEGFLYPRNNRFGKNKTPAALRKVPLFPLLAEHEVDTVNAYINERRLEQKSLSELLFCTAENSAEMINTSSIAGLVSSVLYDLSGGLEYRLYHMRHSALSRMQLILHRDLVELPPVLQALIPYSDEQVDEILTLIVGKSRKRDRYSALAVMAGHSSPAMTLSTYLHFTDCLVGLHLQANQRPFDDHLGQALFGLNPHRIALLKKNKAMHPRETYAYSAKKLLRYTNKLKEQPSTGENPEHLIPRQNSHYIISGAILAKIQNGQSYDELATFYQCDEQRITAWYQTAVALRELKTVKGTSILFPLARRHQILPAAPNNSHEKQDIEEGLHAIRNLRRNQLELTEFKWLLKYALLNSTSSRAGIRFTNPKIFKRFMTIASQLYPWHRWKILLQMPPEQTVSDWACSPHMKTETLPLKRVAQHPKGLARLFLRHVEEEKYMEKGLSQFSSQALNVLLHRLAIIFFTPNQIQAWQNSDNNESTHEDGEDCDLN